MFDVNAAVDEWVIRTLGEQCRDSKRATELADHLHCEIEAARAEGRSAEEAFALATTRMGAPGALAEELAKNRSALAAVCEPLMREERRWRGSGSASTLLLAHALLWAAGLIASAVWLASSHADAATRWTVVGTMPPLWYASDLVVKRLLGASPARGRR